MTHWSMWSNSSNRRYMQKAPVISCFCFLLSETTDECLALLRTCCSSAALHTLELLVSKDQTYNTHTRIACSWLYFLKLCTAVIQWALTFLVQVQRLAGEGEMPPSGRAEDVYERAERLFAATNVSPEAKRRLTVEMTQQPGHLPLVLCIAIRGLVSLAHCDWQITQ